MSRRLAKLRIANDLLLNWLRFGTPPSIVTDRQLPPDAEIVEARVTGQELLELTIRSESYPALEPLQEVPWMDAPVYHAHIVDLDRLAQPSAN